ncbi:hypothetical protein BDW02DRAFT_634967 [Decorospora gaudefroyi]|uniref:Uncharacterized protein n=1 Tax=Decorospora gaudefroyi TaxID=184978 RepID=A0A6A5JXH4_9PLEO|nr:hypothetical protein BDW02DRAFT_634967 [Decorospora gaudefroyi]
MKLTTTIFITVLATLTMAAPAPGPSGVPELNLEVPVPSEVADTNLEVAAGDNKFTCQGCTDFYRTCMRSWGCYWGGSCNLTCYSDLCRAVNGKFCKKSCGWKHCG